MDNTVKNTRDIGRITPIEQLDFILNVRDTVEWETPMDKYIKLSYAVRSILSEYDDTDLVEYINRSLLYRRISKNQVIILESFIKGLYTGDFKNLQTNLQYLDIYSDANAVIMPPIISKSIPLTIPEILTRITIEEFVRYLKLMLRITS